MIEDRDSDTIPVGVGALYDTVRASILMQDPSLSAFNDPATDLVLVAIMMPLLDL